MRNFGDALGMVQNIVLFGTGESGKSSFYKNYKLANDTYNMRHSHLVYIVIMTTTRKCCEWIRRNNVVFGDPVNDDCLELILEVTKNDKEIGIGGGDSQYIRTIHFPLVFSAIKSLWRDEVMMIEALTAVKVDHFIDSITFFKNIKRIVVKEDYQPHLEDLKILVKAAVDVYVKLRLFSQDVNVQTLTHDIAKKKKSLDINTLFVLLADSQMASVLRNHFLTFPKQVQKMQRYSRLLATFYNLLKEPISNVPEYESSVHDILWISSKTTGIIHDNPSIFNNQDICLIDSGGQQSERHKWGKFLKSQKACHIVYVIDLSGFCEVCYESSDNRVIDDLKSLETLVESIRDSEIVLFFNKFDLFAERIKTHEIIIFPEFQGGDSEASLNFIIETYEKVLEKRGIPYMTHVGSALNWKDVYCVLNMLVPGETDESDLKKTSSQRLQQVLKDVSILEVEDTQFTDLSEHLTEMMTSDMTSSKLDHPEILKMIRRQKLDVIDPDATLNDITDISEDHTRRGDSFDLSRALDGDITDDEEDPLDHPDLVSTMQSPVRK